MEDDGPGDVFLQLAIDVDNLFQNTKYTLMQMYEETKTGEFRQLMRSKSMRDIWYPR